MKCLTNIWKTQQITFFEKPVSNLKKYAGVLKCE